MEEYFENRYREPLEDTDQSLERLLRNMGLARDGVLTLAGLLLFAKKPERFRPAFLIKAVALPGRELHETRYLDSEDIFDRLAGQYQRGLAFVKRNLHYVQGDQGINSLGILEIPEIVFQELLVGRLVCNHHFKKCQLADLKLITMSFYGDMQTKRPTSKERDFEKNHSE